MMSAPASRYAAWMARITSGLVSESRSARVRWAPTVEGEGGESTGTGAPTKNPRGLKRHGASVLADCLTWPQAAQITTGSIVVSPQPNAIAAPDKGSEPQPTGGLLGGDAVHLDHLGPGGVARDQG